MTLLIFVAGVVSTFAVATFTDLISEEARARLDTLPFGLLRLAARRLPDDLRDAVYEGEWLPELHHVLRGEQARPITRLYHGVRFSLGLWRAGPRIACELHSAPLSRQVHVSPPSISAVDASDLFVGRSAALAEIAKWITLPDSSALTISAGAGSGKTMIAAQLYQALSSTPGSKLYQFRRAHCPTTGPGELHLHFSARWGADAFYQVVLTWAGGPSTDPDPPDVREILRSLDHSGPVGGLRVILVDALDEAPVAERLRILQLLHQLARRPGVRVIIASRPDPHTALAEAHVIDLDDPRYFAPEDVVQLVEILLASRPLSGQRGAWQTYQQDPVLRRLVAERVAHLSGRSFVLARLTATWLAAQDLVPAALDALPGWEQLTHYLRTERAASVQPARGWLWRWVAKLRFRTGRPNR